MEQLAVDVGTKLQRQPTGGLERILLAEDDEHVRAIAVRILERAGYAVRAVEDGEAACRTAAKESFDLVILDVVMPGLSCRDILARLSALHPTLPVILSSGYAAGANTSVLTQQTGFDMLTKPYDPDRMLHAVRSALDSLKCAT
jgi:DNA-binding NtrC family response regulator